jgi:hypothetical protein
LPLRVGGYSLKIGARYRLTGRYLLFCPYDQGSQRDQHDRIRKERIEGNDFTHGPASFPVLEMSGNGWWEQIRQTSSPLIPASYVEVRERNHFLVCYFCNYLNMTSMDCQYIIFLFLYIFSFIEIFCNERAAYTLRVFLVLHLSCLWYNNRYTAMYVYCGKKAPNAKDTGSGR